MKTITIRLPEALAADIEAESRLRKISKAAVARERLQLSVRSLRRPPNLINAIGDLIGSVDGLPSDLSARKKWHLQVTRYGERRTR